MVSNLLFSETFFLFVCFLFLRNPKGDPVSTRDNGNLVESAAVSATCSVKDFPVLWLVGLVIEFACECVTRHFCMLFPWISPHLKIVTVKTDAVRVNCLFF